MARRKLFMCSCHNACTRLVLVVLDAHIGVHALAGDQLKASARAVWLDAHSSVKDGEVLAGVPACAAPTDRKPGATNTGKWAALHCSARLCHASWSTLTCMKENHIPCALKHSAPTFSLLCLGLHKLMTNHIHRTAASVWGNRAPGGRAGNAWGWCAAACRQTAGSRTRGRTRCRPRSPALAVNVVASSTIAAQQHCRVTEQVHLSRKEVSRRRWGVSNSLGRARGAPTTARRQPAWPPRRRTGT